MKIEKIISTSRGENTLIARLWLTQQRQCLVILIACLIYSGLSAQNDGVIFELGYNINSTFLDRKPTNSPLTTLQERNAINGLHLAVGQRQPLSNLLNIEYALIYDLLGFDALNEQDRHKQSNLGVRLLLQGNITDNLRFAAGSTGYFKSWGDALDGKSIFFDPFLKQKSYFLTANAKISYEVVSQLEAFVSYHYNFTPLYIYDFAANQFPLNLKLYYRFLQVGVGYRISTKPRSINIQRDQ